ncbi:hypothetical protein [Phenylobacterium sp.]|jgi:hypothetical protein|uniref:hypothetical protein n=1 Tax=Phenylobacterium sp. TaxID=1871053 RepID=UPI002F422BBD
MVLKASDELRHPWDGDTLWRESWYYNFSDPTNQIGGWLYLWVLPNQPLKSGMLVSLYHGIEEGIDSNALAWDAPGHLYRGPNDNWVYCYKQDVKELFEADLDDVELCGLSMKRLEPLKGYHLAFRDGDNCHFDIDCRFMSEPWDFADNIHPTPPWLAKNRYHRGWKADGEIVIGGRTYRLKTTGDSDHSWGTRDMTVFGQNNLKTYALQSPDGGLSVKAQLLGPPGKELSRGYIAYGADMRAVKSIKESSRYTPGGLMYDMSLRVEDVDGRVVEAHMDAMYAAVSGAPPRVGYEGAGVWDVKRWGPCAGLASCWWAAGTTPQQLHEGVVGRTP